MKKIDIARRAALLAASATALAASAQAQAQSQDSSSVNIYGSLDLGAYSKQLSGESRTQTLTSGIMNASRWGLRGSEDLGGGLRARFDMSSYIRVDTGEYGRSAADTYFARFSWVGLDSSTLGGIRMGRISTPNFLNTIRYNPFADSSLSPVFMHTYLPSAAQPLMTSQGTTDSAWSNSVAYNSPTWGGFDVALQGAFTEGTSAGRRLGGSVGYTDKALSVGVSLEHLTNMSLNFSKAPASILIQNQKSAQIGASYDFQVAKLFGQYQRATLDGSGSEIQLSTAQVGASAPLGAGRLLASYAHTGKEQTSIADVKRQTVSVGYDYFLSKRTDVYLVVVSDKASSLDRGNGIALGIRHNF